MDHEILDAVQDLLEGPGGGLLAVVVRASGSVPREAGAKMVVFADGRIAGTVGGGALEKRVLDLAPEVIAEGLPRLLEIDLGQDLGMQCGGRVALYLEPVRPRERLVIFGGGHIGHALHRLAPLLGLRPVVVDERPEFAAAQRFPGAEVVCARPAEAAPRLAVGPRDFVVVVTHQHHHDLEAVRAVIALRPRYLGMIGSRKKVAETRAALRAEGVAEELLVALRAPIGLDLGGRTPGEIAVAIAAEIIALRSGRSVPVEFSW